jgi:hypothetical protein
MATYQQDITRNIEPAMADPTTLVRGKAAQAQAIGSLITGGAQLGKAIYKDVQTSALREDLQTSVNTLQKEMDDVKAADITAKTIFQQERKALPSLVEEYRAASLLTGSDPEEAKELAKAFSTQQENEIVKRYRSEQQRIIAARDAIPAKYNDFMMRSEASLKKYIAQHPMLADEFRNVSQEVTGKRGLEMYSVGKLYEDVNYIEKQTAEQAKRAEQQQQVLQNAYVEDRVKGGTSKTQALLEFNAVEPSQRIELANAAVEAARSKEEAKTALEQGGNNILNFANITVSGFKSDLIAKNAATYAQLSALGISRAQIASGNIPEAVKNSAQYKAIVDKAGTETLQLLDVQYNTAVQQLNTRARTTPADADKVKTSLAVLDDWYASSKDFYTKNPTSFLVGIATKDDRESDIQRRLNIVDTMVRSLGIPADVVAQLGMSGDSKLYNDARAKYPRAAAIITHANMLREKVLSGVSTDEFVQLMAGINKYKDNPGAAIPETKNDATGSLATHKQLQQKVVDISQGTQTADPVDDISKYLISVFQQPANAEQFLLTGQTATQVALGKLSESDRANVNEQVKTAANQYIYGESGHGNKAKGFYDDYVKTFANYPGVDVNASKVIFSDTTGMRPLRVEANRVPRANLSPQEQRTFTTYTKVASQPTATNNALSAVDEMLRVQSRVTNTPVEQLRKEFIDAFTGAATVSEGRTKSFVQAATKDSGRPTTTPTTPSSTAPRIARMVDVASFAKKEKVSLEDAEKALEAAGYTLTGN